MNSPAPYLNISFYQFFDWPDYASHRKALKSRAVELGLKGTLLITPEGINGFLAASVENIREFQKYLAEVTGQKLTNYKDSFSNQAPFGKMVVKLKKEIIATGLPHIKPHQKTGTRLLPEELKRWYDEGKEFQILDTRNDYEVEYGTFENATQLGIQHFRQFAEKLKTVPESLRKAPTVMFCTGGIRCEKATAIAMEQGFQEVYQLEGGILKYFEEMRGAHYKGDCFVFDGRVALNPELKPSGVKRKC